MNPIRLAELNNLFDRYREATVALRLERFRVPLNAESERNRFLDAFDRGEAQDPQFRYEPLPPDIGQALSELRRDYVVREYWGGLLIESVEHTLATITALRSRDPELLTHVSTTLYGDIDAQLLVDARLALQTTVHADPPERTIDAPSAADRLRGVLSGVGLDRWTVEVEPRMNARISVDAKSERVRIRADTGFAPSELNRLTVHEFGTHVFRAANGALQPLRMLSVGWFHSLSTEEGLAIFQEHRYGVAEASAHRRYALRVLAAEASLKGSFSDAFRSLLPHSTPSEAWEICVRAKRGFVETSRPGASSKDIVYMRGYRQIVNYLADHPQDLSLLYVGKIGLEMLPAARSLADAGILRAPAYAPDLIAEYLS